jgi:hypothetical protein
METIEQIYTDAAIIEEDEPVHVGVWAFRRVGQGDLVLSERVGIVTPADLGADCINSGVAEMYAILRALEACPPGWIGRVWTDNTEALRWCCLVYQWLTMGNQATRDGHVGLMRAGVPLMLWTRCYEAMAEMGSVGFSLLAGHASDADFAAGFKIRRSGEALNVSPHNSACDSLCRREATRWKEGEPSSRPLLVFRNTPASVWPGTPEVKRKEAVDANS